MLGFRRVPPQPASTCLLCDGLDPSASASQVLGYRHIPLYPHLHLFSLLSLVFSMPLNGIVLLLGPQAKDCLLHPSTPILVSPCDQRLLLLKASAAPLSPGEKPLQVGSLGSCSFCSPHQQAYPAVCGGPHFRYKGFQTFCRYLHLCSFSFTKDEDD